MMEIWAHVMAPLWFSMRKNDSVGLKLNTRVVTRMRISKFWEIQSHHSCWGYFRVVACDIWLEPSPRSITKLEDFPEYMPHQPWVPIRRATQTSDSSRFRVSGFRFRVSGFGFRRLKPTFAVGFGFRVSGFGFRRLKPTFAVGFGFRVSISPGEVKSSESVLGFGFRVSGFGFRRLKPTFAVGFGFRVSGFGFRRLKPTFAVGFGFRVSISPGEVKSSESISGFGFRVSGFDRSWGRSVFRVGFGFRVSGFGFRSARGKVSLQSRFRVSGFGFRSVLGKLSLQSRFRVSGFGFRSSKPTLIVGFGFRVSGFGFRWSKPTLQTSLRITSPNHCNHSSLVGRDKGRNKQYSTPPKVTHHCWLSLVYFSPLFRWLFAPCWRDHDDWRESAPEVPAKYQQIASAFTIACLLPEAASVACFFHLGLA